MQALKSDLFNQSDGEESSYFDAWCSAWEFCGGAKSIIAPRKLPNDKAKSLFAQAIPFATGRQVRAPRRDKISKFAQHTRSGRQHARPNLLHVICCILATCVCITGGPSHKLLFSFFSAPDNIWHGTQNTRSLKDRWQQTKAGAKMQTPKNSVKE
jgi:hypothetical protein